MYEIRLRNAVCALFFCAIVTPVLAGAQTFPPGMQPVTDGNYHCFPLDDRSFYPSPSEPGAAAFEHGNVCLDELQYGAAATKFRESLHLGLATGDAGCATVSLGIAYDGLYGRGHPSGLWEYANGKAPLAPTLGLETPLLRRDDSVALSILERLFVSKTPYAGVVTSYTGLPQNGLMKPFDDALRLAASGHPDRGARWISDLYRRGLSHNGVARYARAVMLIAIDRTSEARLELQLAARESTVPVAGDDCFTGDYQWSALYLIEHLDQRKRGDFAAPKIAR